MWQFILDWGIPLLFGGIICYVITGIIDRKTIQQKMFEEQMKKALTTLVDTCENKIRLKDMIGDKEIEIKGDGISSEIEEGQVIYAA